MPRPSQGARLYLRERTGRDPVWVILDGKEEIVAARGASARQEAEKRLGEYLSGKHRPVSDRDPDRVQIADILTNYAKHRAEKVARADLIGYAMTPLLQFFGESAVGILNSTTCEAYRDWRCAQPRPQFKDAETAPRISESTTRRELGVLAAAVNSAYKKGLLLRPVPVTLPAAAPARERHLSRSEVAAMLWGALGFERRPDGSLRRHGQGASRHLCRFILLAVYTGTRHDAVLRLRWTPSTESGWIDVERGLVYRRGNGERQTKKRRPPVPIPHSLLPHVRRWHRLGSASGYVIEFDGKQILKQRTAWSAAQRRAGLGSDVTPHVLKHTCATWLLQAGRPIWEVAGYLGTTEKVIRDVYGHHSPDYLLEAAKAL